MHGEGVGRVRGAWFCVGQVHSVGGVGGEAGVGGAGCDGARTWKYKGRGKPSCHVHVSQDLSAGHVALVLSVVQKVGLRTTQQNNTRQPTPKQGGVEWVTQTPTRHTKHTTGKQTKQAPGYGPHEGKHPPPPPNTHSRTRTAPPEWPRGRMVTLCRLPVCLVRMAARVWPASWNAVLRRTSGRCTLAVRAGPAKHRRHVTLRVCSHSDTDTCQQTTPKRSTRD